jgi:glycosyltransferase involved in cell wall biosynthesis
MTEQSELRIAWHWFSMGPYHFARMAAVAQIPGVELTVIENTSRDDHNWQRYAEPDGFRVISLGNEMLSPLVLRQSAQEYAGVLERERPDVIVECGYSDRHSCRTVLRHIQQHRSTLALFWSESALNDHRRVWWREMSKRILLREFDGALCAGEPHRRYLEQLGMPGGNLCISGGSVDNDFFSRESERARSQPALRSALGLPERYFLYVGRFIEQKNLRRLLQAYRMYRSAAADPAGLVLVGGGPDEPALREMARCDQIEGVQFAGLKQVAELPAYYALATCFVLPSISEPWGLVVNEALASGLPALVSRNCGCAEDLVLSTKSGLTFDPYSVYDLAQLMTRVTADPSLLPEMRERGRAAVAGFDPAGFAQRSVRHIRELRRLIGKHDRNRAASRLLRNLVLAF